MGISPEDLKSVVPYIGTWIETVWGCKEVDSLAVVPYIGTWIETPRFIRLPLTIDVVPYIGTWIETKKSASVIRIALGRTLYRYVD